MGLSRISESSLIDNDTPQMRGRRNENYRGLTMRSRYSIVWDKQCGDESVYGTR